MPDQTLMILGLGNLGSYALDILVRRPAGPRLIVAGRDEEALVRRMNLARLTAAQLGYDREVSTAVVDANEVEATAETLARLRPDIVFTTMSLQAWWVVTRLPEPVRSRLDEAGFGPWLPMHLARLYDLMRAVRMSGITTKVVNAAFPDAVNPTLRGVGLEPYIGIGNVANPVPALRLATAEELGEPVAEVSVRLVAAHYASTRLPRLGHSGGAPYRLCVLVGDKDVSGFVEPERIARRAASRYRRLGGTSGGMLTAASAVTVLDAIQRPEATSVHAPAPHGLPGGYPIKASVQGVQLDLPHGLTLPEARRINEAGLAYDGIDRITEDGAVHFTERAHQVMRRELGHDCPMVRPADSAQWAGELAARFAELSKRSG